MKTFLAIAVFTAFQFASAQKTIELNSFKSLAVSGGMEITLVKSSENKLVIEKGDPDKLKVTSENGYLALSYKNNITSDSIEVIVYYNSAIGEIAVSGGVEIISKSSITSPSLSISAAGGSEVNIRAEVEKLTVAAVSGSEVTLSGMAKNQEASVASGAKLNAAKLTTENTTVTVASGGEATIYATGVVTATVASGGQINIEGNPKKLNEVKAQGGEITMVK